MPVTPYPGTIPSRLQAQADFDANYSEYIAWQVAAAVEINQTIGLLNATSGAGAIVIPYTFSTTTTDSDPGNGVLRLNQATQNTATVIRADLLGSDALDKTAMLGLLTASSSTSKGYIRLVHATDATKYLTFQVTALASPTGYRNITVTLIASSAASPFANSDAIVLYFTRAGDLMSAVGDSAVVVHSGNGHGSTNTAIRRFTTTLTNTGTAITYADSATLGGSFTINETGMYAIFYSDTHNSAAGTTHGVSVNSTELTTAIASITPADRRFFAVNPAGGQVGSASHVIRCQAGDVVRPHSQGTQNGASAAVMFSIRKVGL